MFQSMWQNAMTYSSMLFGVLDLIVFSNAQFITLYVLRLFGGLRAPYKISLGLTHLGSDASIYVQKLGHVCFVLVINLLIIGLDYYVWWNIYWGWWHFTGSNWRQWLQSLFKPDKRLHDGTITFWIFK